MKRIDKYINEKIVLNKSNIKNYAHQYNYYPENIDELRDILDKLLSERGQDADLNDIDISNLTSLNKAFYQLNPRNIDVSKWDVSNIKSMDDMFFNCFDFDVDLSSWDVSNVKSMYNMFNSCDNFKGKGLEKWDVSSVEDMSEMFYDCKKLNVNLDSWDISNVVDMYHMFYGCKEFNQELPSWPKKIHKDCNTKNMFSIHNTYIPTWYTVWYNH